jgi:hypothetical protein
MMGAILLARRSQHGSLESCNCRVLIVVILVGGLACGEPPNRTPSSSLGDWSVITTVDAATGAFANAYDAVLLSDGALAIADIADQQVKLFDQRGELVSALGRHGRGPGEFEGLNSIVLGPADTILAYDGHLSRLTVISSSGTLVYTESYRELVPPTSKLIAVVDTGQLLLLGETTPGPRQRAEGVVTDSTLLLVVDRRSRVVKDLGTIPLRRLIVDGTGAAVLVTSSPIPVAVTVGVCGDRVLVAYGDDSELHWYRVDSASHEVASVNLTREPVDDALLDSMIEAVTRRGATDLSRRAAQAQERHRRQLRNPYFWSAALDIDASVWLRLGKSRGDSTARWLNVDMRGNVTERPAIHSPGRILSMNERTILVHTTGEDGLGAFSVLSRPEPRAVSRCDEVSRDAVNGGLIG